jgi:hypothetical protein
VLTRLQDQVGGAVLGDQDDRLDPGSICSQIPGVKPPVSDLRKDALSSSSSRASARPTAVISRALQISPPNAGAGTFSSAVDSRPFAGPERPGIQ